MLEELVRWSARTMTRLQEFAERVAYMRSRSELAVIHLDSLPRLHTVPKADSLVARGTAAS
jgi:hypothetical protein